MRGHAEWCGKWKCTHARVVTCPASLCLSVGAFNPFTFKVIINIMILLPSSWAFLVAQRLKCLPAMRETQVRSLGREDPLEKEMAAHSSTLAWRLPRREEPGGLQSMGSQRVGHDCTTSLHHVLNCFRFIFCRSFPALVFLPREAPFNFCLSGKMMVSLSNLNESLNWVEYSWL